MITKDKLILILPFLVKAVAKTQQPFCRPQRRDMLFAYNYHVAGFKHHNGMMGCCLFTKA